MDKETEKIIEDLLSVKRITHGFDYNYYRYGLENWLLNEKCEKIKILEEEDLIMDDIFIMSADEARLKSHEHNENSSFTILTNIINKIDEKINKGEYECFIFLDIPLPVDVHKVLIENGYIINEEYNPMECSYTITIKW